MDKYLIILYVPKVEEKYEVFIPVNKKMNLVISLLEKAILEITDHYYIPNQKSALYDRYSGEKVDSTAFVKDSIVKNGSELVLL